MEDKQISVNNFLTLNNTKWYAELNQQWPGQAFIFSYAKLLLEKKTAFQEMRIFESEKWGKVLVLDDAIQLTERDEFIYHEMISHLPLLSHSCPKRVLIVGGGDGMVVREVLKHPEVEEVLLCEIDQDVIDACRKHFPLESWQNPKLQIRTADASQLVQSEEFFGYFDVIICDSSDPVGSAKSLFEEKFYSNLKNCLRKDGVISFQAESIWNDVDFVTQLKKRAKAHFKSVRYSSIQIPTYPCGQIGLMICSDMSIERMLAFRPCVFQDSLKYFSPEIASASFVLPPFALIKFRAVGEKTAERSDDHPSAKTSDQPNPKRLKA